MSCNAYESFTALEQGPLPLIMDKKKPKVNFDTPSEFR